MTDENAFAKKIATATGIRCPDTGRMVKLDGRPNAADLEEGRIEYDCECSSRHAFELPIGPAR